MGTAIMRSAPVALEDAPSEFRLLGETFSNMAAAVQDRDRRLRDAVAQKSLLIKETHHRVEEQLQIVMSLLSLQAGQLKDPAVQSALKQAQIRVNALALVHRILHEIEELDAVDLKPLIEDLAHQIQEGFGADRRDLNLELEIASRLVPSDLAVRSPFSPFEALTNAFKHAYPPGTRGGIFASCYCRSTMANCVSPSKTMVPGPPAEAATGGIGSRLIKAFGQQVGGIADVRRVTAAVRWWSCFFPIRYSSPSKRASISLTLRAWAVGNKRSGGPAPRNVESSALSRRSFPSFRLERRWTASGQPHD